jgi:hypothetical protein
MDTPSATEGLQQVIAEVEQALGVLREPGSGDGDTDEVDAHRFDGYWAENRQRAITPVEDALQALRELEPTQDEREDSDVEAHAAYRWSDENLKQAIERIEDALAALNQLETQQPDQDADVEAHRILWSDENLKQAITALTNALGALKAIESKPKA